MSYTSGAICAAIVLVTLLWYWRYSNRCKRLAELGFGSNLLRESVVMLISRTDPTKVRFYDWLRYANMLKLAEKWKAVPLSHVARSPWGKYGHLSFGCSARTRDGREYSAVVVLGFHVEDHRLSGVVRDALRADAKLEDAVARNMVPCGMSVFNKVVTSHTQTELADRAAHLIKEWFAGEESAAFRLAYVNVDVVSPAVVDKWLSQQSALYEAGWELFKQWKAEQDAKQAAEQALQQERQREAEELEALYEELKRTDLPKYLELVTLRQHLAAIEAVADANQRALVEQARQRADAAVSAARAARRAARNAEAVTAVVAAGAAGMAVAGVIESLKK